MGIDLRGGVMAVFDTEDGATESEINATIARLDRVLTERGYTEATVVRQGDKIRIEVPAMNDPQEIFDAIGEPEELVMHKMPNGQEGEPGEVFLRGENIESVEYYMTEEYEHAVIVNFTREGTRLFSAAVKEAGQGGYIGIFFADGTRVSVPSINDENAGSTGSTVITGGWETQEAAEAFKLQIESGLFETKLEVNETSVIPPTLGEGALTGGIIACAIGLLFIFVFMYIMYGDLGLLSNLSIVIYMVIFLVCLAAVGSVQLTLPGIAGIILSLGMAVDANVVIFETVKDQYKSGKRMGVAIENGFNKSGITIFDANITTIIASGVLYLLGTGAIKGFAITLFLGVAISMFCSLVVTRGLAKLYLYINPNNARKLRLKSDNQTTTTGSAASAPKQRVRTLNK
jgi:preprotein translocase subunit SecD